MYSEAYSSKNNIYLWAFLCSVPLSFTEHFSSNLVCDLYLSYHVFSDKHSKLFYTSILNANCYLSYAFLLSNVALFEVLSKLEYVSKLLNCHVVSKVWLL